MNPVSIHRPIQLIFLGILSTYENLQIEMMFPWKDAKEKEKHYNGVMYMIHEHIEDMCNIAFQMFDEEIDHYEIFEYIEKEYREYVKTGLPVYARTIQIVSC